MSTLWPFRIRRFRASTPAPAPPIWPFHIRRIAGRPAVPVRAVPPVWPFMIRRFRPPALPIDLPEAIAHRLDTDAAVSLLFGSTPGVGTKFWALEAPLGVALPYLVVIPVWENFSYTSAAGYLGDAQIQVSVFAEGLASAKTLSKAATRYLNLYPPIMSGAILAKLRLSDTLRVLDDTKGPNGADVWQMIANFDAILSRSL